MVTLVGSLLAVGKLFNPPRAVCPHAGTLQVPEALRGQLLGWRGTGQTEARKAKLAARRPTKMRAYIMLNLGDLLECFGLEPQGEGDWDLPIMLSVDRVLYELKGVYFQNENGTTNDPKAVVLVGRGK